MVSNGYGRWGKLALSYRRYVALDVQNEPFFILITHTLGGFAQDHRARTRGGYIYFPPDAQATTFLLPLFFEDIHQRPPIPVIIHRQAQRVHCTCTKIHALGQHIHFVVGFNACSPCEYWYKLVFISLAAVAIIDASVVRRQVNLGRVSNPCIFDGVKNTPEVSVRDCRSVKKNAGGE